MTDATEPEPGRSTLLAFCHPEMVTADFVLCMLAVTNMPGTPVAQVLGYRTGPLLSYARGKIAEQFLGTGLDWLWMVDTDMIFNQFTLPALLDWADPDERPVLGALCRTMMTDGKIITTAYRYDPAETRPGYSSYADSEVPPDQLLRVDATGCACLLIHRSVFAKLGCTAELAFAEKIHGGRVFGEDVSFCMRLAEAEIPLYVHSGIQVGHLKHMQIGNLSP